jgi:hypothetical protein
MKNASIVAFFQSLASVAGHPKLYNLQWSYDEKSKSFIAQTLPVKTAYVLETARCIENLLGLKFGSVTGFHKPNESVRFMISETAIGLTGSVYAKCMLHINTMVATLAQQSRNRKQVEQIINVLFEKEFSADLSTPGLKQAFTNAVLSELGLLTSAVEHKVESKSSQAAMIAGRLSGGVPAEDMLPLPSVLARLERVNSDGESIYGDEEEPSSTHSGTYSPTHSEPDTAQYAPLEEPMIAKPQKRKWSLLDFICYRCNAASDDAPAASANYRPGV